MCFGLLGCSVLGSGLCAAQGQTVPIIGPYVSLEGGLDFEQDQILQPIRGLEPKRDLHLDLPGFAGEVSLGYGLGHGLRVELEGNYLNDHVRKVEFPGPQVRRAGGYEQQYGGFANALYDIPSRLPVTPYIGVGVGGQALEFDHLNSSSPGFHFPRPIGSSSIGSFAYQAIAGLSAPLPWVRGLDLTAEYRFIGLPDSLPTIPFTAYSARTGQAIGEGRQRVGNVFHHSILFGVRYAFNTAPPPRPPVVPAAPSAEARTYLVFFDWDRSDLTIRAREILAQVAQASTYAHTTRVEVDGHTDTSSIHDDARGARYNQDVSIRRATSVKAELIRDGVPSNTIDIHGFGETHPLVPTGPNDREPQNRRVEIILRRSRRQQHAGPVRTFFRPSSLQRL